MRADAAGVPLSQGGPTRSATMTDRSADKSLFSLAQIQHLMRVEFSRAQRYGYPISCLMIAVDRLGHLRDMYGYEAKEEIIDALVDLLKHATRNSDFLGRMADDRLLAVVPHTGPTGIRCLATRLVEQVHQLEFDSDGRRIPITVAIGGSHDGSDEGGEPPTSARCSSTRSSRRRRRRSTMRSPLAGTAWSSSRLRSWAARDGGS